MAGDITCQTGSTELAVAPSSRMRRRKAADRSVWRTPGRASGRTSAMAASLIRCAWARQASSSAVLQSLAAPSSGPASTSVAPLARSWSSSGHVYSSTATGPLGWPPSASNRVAASGPPSSTGSASWRWSTGISDGMPSANGVQTCGGEPSAAITATARCNCARACSDAATVAPVA